MRILKHSKINLVSLRMRSVDGMGGKDLSLKIVKENVACRDIHDTEDRERTAFWSLIVLFLADVLQTLLGEKQSSLKLIVMQLEYITANGYSASHWVQWLCCGYENNTYKSWEWSWDSMCLLVGLTSLHCCHLWVLQRGMWLSVPTNFHLTCRHSSDRGTDDLKSKLTDRKRYTRHTLSQYTVSLRTVLSGASRWGISQDGNISQYLLRQVRHSLVFIFECRLKTSMNQITTYVRQISI